MPYTIRKADCKQASGKSGSYTLSYTDKKGKHHRICHTSKKKAKGQISAIEMRESDCPCNEEDSPCNEKDCPCNEKDSLIESFAYNVIRDMFSL